MRYVLVVLLAGRLAAAAVAPSFQGETLTGDRIALKDRLKPGRVTLVSFWATWCGPCLEELHKVTEHLAKNTALPLDVLTVNEDTSETASDVRPTVKLHKIAFPVILDPTQEILAKYNPTKALPFSALVGPDGKIAATYTGFHEEMFAEVTKLTTASAK